MLINTPYPIAAVVTFLITSAVDAFLFLLLLRPLLAILPIIRHGPTAYAVMLLVEPSLCFFHGWMNGHFGRCFPRAFAWLTFFMVLLVVRYMLMWAAVDCFWLDHGVVM